MIYYQHLGCPKREGHSILWPLSPSFGVDTVPYSQTNRYLSAKEPSIARSYSEVNSAFNLIPRGNGPWWCQLFHILWWYLIVLLPGNILCWWLHTVSTSWKRTNLEAQTFPSFWSLPQNLLPTKTRCSMAARFKPNIYHHWVPNIPNKKKQLLIGFPIQNTSPKLT